MATKSEEAVTKQGVVEEEVIDLKKEDEVQPFPESGGGDDPNKSFEFFDQLMARNPSGESGKNVEAEAKPETLKKDEVQTDETAAKVESGEVDEPSAVELLRAEISKMAAVMASHGVTYNDTPTIVAEEKEAKQEPVQKLNEATIPASPTAVWGPVVKVSDKDFQDSLEDKGAFEKVLTSVRDQAVERTIQSLPQIVTNMVKQQLYLHELSTEFYKANEDLAGLRPFVGVVANEIASKNTGLSPQEVLDKTAVEVRKRLQLKDKAVSKVSTTNPALPNAVTRSKAEVKPQLTGLSKDINDLLAIK